METSERSIAGLYYNYKNRSEKDIAEFLTDKKFVVLTNKGTGTVQGYYPYNKKAIDILKEDPRRVSYTFESDKSKLEDSPIELKPIKRFPFLCKSSSRFFLKPDIGEVIDQIPFEDYLFSKHYDAVMIEEGYETLKDTEGEHHIMYAQLLKKV